MLRLFPSNDGECVPLVIDDGNSVSGSRLGGRPPAGVVPGHITPLTRYFCTIRIAEDPVLEISVFLSLDFDSMADGAGIIHASGEVIEAIVHCESLRGDDTVLASELTPHPIRHERTCEDYLIDEDGNHVVRSHHKLGGSPFLQDTGEGLPAAVRQMRDEGCFQVVQIDFPGADDGDVEGDWPFAGGIFHLFGSNPMETCLWRCFWEY